MGFFTGRLTFTRFRVTGRTPRNFGLEHLEQLEANAIGTQRIAAADGSSVGWIAGDHILDTRFDLAKNIVHDALHFGLRMDTQNIPADLLRAYTQVELEGLTEPGAVPGARLKREARMRARERLEREAQDGRYLRRKAIPLLWDAQSGELLAGTTSLSAIDRLLTHFRQTYHHGLELLGAGRQAFQQAETRNQNRAVDDATLSHFTAAAQNTVAWLPDDSSRDFLGNEFLVWLWYYLENESDTLVLADESEAVIMLARTLSLECPRGQTGKQSLQSDGPTKLPEALRALQSGKLPRRAGMTVVRHDHQYELTLQAETLAISGARLPVAEAVEDRARLEERVTQVRHMIETLDLIYNQFGQHRFGGHWDRELGKIKKWLKAPG
jgi:hypothetical protein